MQKKLISLFLILGFLFTAIPINIATETTDDSLPTYFYWGDVDGVDYLPPMKNQAPAPTCEAYALCDAIETKIHYKLQENIDCDLSEAHLFFYSGGTTNWGVPLQSAANYSINPGIPDEGCFPDPHRPMDTPFESLEGWENRTVNITGWHWVPLEEEDIKQELIEYGPLVICVLVRNDFTYYRRGIYTPGSGRITGGHVITLVGYDDEQSCWIIRNTWGDSWGEDGYIRVAYDVDTEENPFFRNFYGGTGIMAIEDVEGIFEPSTPRIEITTPEIYTTYFLGIHFPFLIRSIPTYQSGAPRIIGPLTIEMTTEQTDNVSLYMDGTFVESSDSPPFSFSLPRTTGLHTIEVYAYNSNGVSKDIIDVEIIV